MSKTARLDPGRREARAERTRECLGRLQEERLRHDELHHRDVCALPLSRRLLHNALQFADCVGRIAETLLSGRDVAFRRTLVDAFATSLAAANALEISLADRVPSSMPATGNDPKAWFLLALARSAGRIAKACESLAYEETCLVRDELAEGVADLAHASIAVAAQLGVDLPAAVRGRLREIEKLRVLRRLKDAPYPPSCRGGSGRIRRVFARFARLGGDDGMALHEGSASCIQGEHSDASH